MPTLAENAVKNCLRIRPDDNVTIFFYPHTLSLAEDLATECFKVGADALLNLYTDKYYSAYMKHLSTEKLRQPSAFCRGLSNISTATFWLGAAYDPIVYRRVPPEKMAANDEAETEAHLPMRDRKVRSLGLAIGQVTRPRAKAYGFNFATWERMVQEASAVPAKTLTATGQRLAGILGTADDVHVTAPSGTDLTFSVQGRQPMIYDGIVDDEDIAAGVFESSIPSGSVTILPQESSAEGVVVFDVPQAWAGRSIRCMRWECQVDRSVPVGRPLIDVGDVRRMCVPREQGRWPSWLRSCWPLLPSGRRARSNPSPLPSDPRPPLFLRGAFPRSSWSASTQAPCGTTNSSRSKTT